MEDLTLIHFIILFIAGAIIAGLAGAGALATFFNQQRHDVEAMTRLEDAYKASNQAYKEAIQVVGQFAGALALAMPTEDAKRMLVEGSKFIGEISDDIPLRKKQPTLSGEDSPLPTSESIKRQSKEMNAIG